MSGFRPVKRSFYIHMTCISFLGSSRLHLTQNENFESNIWKKNYHFWRKFAEIACFLAFTKRFDPKVLHLLRLHACLRCNFSCATLEKLAICLQRPKLGSDYDLVSITKSDKTHRKHNFRNSKPYQTVNYISGMEVKANFNTLYC